jgi:ROS/MUCR transcriptional regulator protein
VITAIGWGRSQMKDGFPPPFASRSQIERYFSGTTIRCLLCGERFRRLQSHLRARHGWSTDEYRVRFGLPWSRGLVSKAAFELASARWTAARRKQARQLAMKSRFFELAHSTPRRDEAPFNKAEHIRRLRIKIVDAASFKREARALIAKGLTRKAIAKALGVDKSTLYSHMRSWRHK